MTAEQETAMVIKGVAASLPEPERSEVALCVAKLRALIDERGDSAKMAIALIGSELAV